MKYTIVLLFFLPFPFLTHANDGAFRANGNQLIPIYETDIAIRKEILTIRRINASQAQIEVYYEFFNPKAAKFLEVGFEAFSPSGDADKTPDEDGQQPYISHFTVMLNGENLPFKVSLVHDSLYFRNGQYKAISVAKAKKEIGETEDVDFLYVYHFKALFKQGLNVIHHTYTVDLSNSINEKYSLRYVLTAAKRWSNRQIDDFTLQIDMGEFQDVSIQNTFFGTASEWKTDSTVKRMQLKAEKGPDAQNDTSEFFIRKGLIALGKKNFRPIGELVIQSFSSYYYRVPAIDNGNAIEYSDKFDSKSDNLPFSLELQDEILPPADDLSKKILHNLPFARRGYLFKIPELASYYEKQKWYMPNPEYAAESKSLTIKEQKWLQKY